MSKQYDIKQHILYLMDNPEDKECAEQLLLDALEISEEDFEYENDETIDQYLFGDE